MVEMEQEMIYGTHEDSHVVMSDKVQSLAGSIYQEFEKMISKYDEDVVKDLMPLVVNVLECLDLAYTENQEHQVELELLREDNEQLVTQYEREKQLRKVSEQKLLEVEDLVEDERKEKGGKIESLESIVKILELKSKNASDHVYRLEEKEQENKKEFSKLHERYTELFKTHMDYIERANILMGTNTDRETRSRLPPLSLAHINRSSGPVSFGFQSLESSVVSRVTTSPGDFQPALPASPPDSNHSPLRNQLAVADSPEEEVSESKEKGWSETISPKDQTSPDTSEESPPPRLPTTPPSRTTTNKEQRIGNTLYQELSFQDSEALSEMDEGADITGNWVHPGEYASSVNDNFFGMGKEVENLIMENHELLETKNALNIVKDDLIIKVDELTSEQEILREELKSLNAVKARLMLKVSDLEEELKKAREELEKTTKSSKSDDEEDVPMAQRKRFTRVEMARVLMERNQYKERYMELQEAVRFTEMIRASRHEPNIDKKNKNNIWGFFSSLFSSSGGSGDKMMGSRRGVGYHGAMAYHSQSHHLSPALDTMRKRSMHDRRRGLEISDTPASDMGKEELRCVRAHVGRREDGRLQAYGWSLPAAPAPRPPPKHPPPSNHVPVPVPVYCRPLMEKDDSMKMWCAAAVNLTGGKTRDGGSIVGASVFYSNDDDSQPNSNDNHNPSSLGPVEQLEKDLKEGEKGMKDRDKQVLSSLVWICTSTRSVSYVTVIDANNPADILEVFSVCQSCLLCIASVPGASESDYKEVVEEPVNEEDIVRPEVPQPVVMDDEEDEDAGVGSDGPASSEDSGLAGDSGPDLTGGGPESVDVGPDQLDDKITVSTENKDIETSASSSNGSKDTNVMNNLAGTSCESESTPPLGKITFVSCATGSEATDTLPPPPPPPSNLHLSFMDANSNEVESLSPPRPRRLLKQFKEGLFKDGVTPLPQENDLACEEVEKMSSVLPTMWLGAQNGYIFVHSAVSQWKRCIHSKQLKDSVLSIVHCGGRVICSLANCTLAVFARGHDAQWDLNSYHLVDLGPPQPMHSIRCLSAVHSRLWAGYKNQIHILDPNSMQILRSVEVHPRKESQVRAMAWLGDGVWVSIRLDSTLRLYHAHTYQHLQDVDIEPYVSKMLGTGKLGFSFARITSLLIACSRLWIGTGNGVIISVPLSDSNSGVKVYADPDSSQITPATFVPYCSMQHAQLSFHGHRDSVKFFVAVPGSGGVSSAPVIDNAERPASMLVMSGGEGYVDFRVGDDEEVDNEGQLRCEPCYLIVWQVAPPPLPEV